MPTIARNLGSAGRRLRLVSGLVMLALGVAMGALLVAAGVARGARLALFILFFFAGLGLLQARDHT